MRKNKIIILEGDTLRELTMKINKFQQGRVKVINAVINGFLHEWKNGLNETRHTQKFLCTITYKKAFCKWLNI